MTNNKLTPKNVTRYAQYGVDMMEWPDGAYVKYEDYAALAAELQERRKAAIDSEPVAWISQSNLDALSRGHDAMVKSTDNVVQPVPLYRHAQPAQVVPDDYQRLRELYHAQEKRLFKIAQRIKGPAFDKYSHSPSQAIDVLEGAIFGEDEACRAAMLNGGKS